MVGYAIFIFLCALVGVTAFSVAIRKSLGIAMLKKKEENEDTEKEKEG